MMLCDNMIALRRLHNMTQEDVAEKIGVARQTISKWEAGESMPDLERTRALAALFDVSLDELVENPSRAYGLAPAPRGKHVFGMVRVGEKGQIVLPADARRTFRIQPGDNLMVLGDEGQGIALISEKSFLDMINTARMMMEGNDK